MATNQQAAARFASPIETGKPLTGYYNRTKSSTLWISPQSHHLARTGIASQFEVMAEANSYSTLIARLVRNTYTGHFELWMTPNRYSDTTLRHKTLLLSAFRSASNPATDIYYSTPAGEGYYERDVEVRNNIGTYLLRVRRHLHTAIKPKIHEATRLTEFMNAKHKLEYQLRLATEGIAPERIDHDAVGALTEQLAFIAPLAAPLTPTNLSMAERRAVVEGFFALEKE